MGDWVTPSLVELRHLGLCVCVCVWRVWIILLVFLLSGENHWFVTVRQRFCGRVEKKEPSPVGISGSHPSCLSKPTCWVSNCPSKSGHKQSDQFKMPSCLWFLSFLFWVVDDMAGLWLGCDLFCRGGRRPPFPCHRFRIYFSLSRPFIYMSKNKKWNPRPLPFPGVARPTETLPRHEGPSSCLGFLAPSTKRLST